MEHQSGQVGPVERKLDQFGQLQGFVFGAFGEGSEDIHKIVKILSQSRLKAAELQRGGVGLKGELGMITDDWKIGGANLLRCEKYQYQICQITGATGEDKLMRKRIMTHESGWIV